MKSGLKLKVMREGRDISSDDPRDILVSSDMYYLKVWKVIYFSGAGSKKHGLKYPPVHTWLEKDSSTGYWQVGGLDRKTYGVSVSVDDTTVYADKECYVILFVDPLNEKGGHSDLTIE